MTHTLQTAVQQSDAQEPRRRFRDSAPYILGTTLLALEIAALFYGTDSLQPSLFKKVGPSSKPELARVTEIIKEVKARASGKLAWYPLSKGQPIRKGDTLITGPQSLARVQIKDGGEIEIGPETLLVFSEDIPVRSGELFTVAVEQGAVSVHSKRLPINLVTPNHQVRIVAPGEMRLVSKPMDSSPYIEVGRGKAEVFERSKPTASLKLNSGQTVGYQHAPSPISTITAPTAYDSFPRVTLKMPALDPKLTVSRNNSYISEPDLSPRKAPSIQPRLIPTPQVIPQLGPQRLPTLIPSILRAPKIKGATTVTEYQANSNEQYPALGQIQNYALVTFEWEWIEQAAQYHFEISSSPNFDSQLYTVDIPQPIVQVSLVTPADYYWRVIARAPNGTFGEWSYIVPFSLGQVEDTEDTEGPQ